MTKTESTSKTHEFLPSGCRYQWAADHDDADCWEAFQQHQEKEEVR
jgi:hypothetical protein